MAATKSKKSAAAVPQTTSPRKRPVQERSQRRLQAIVDSAANAFAEFGFEATTMDGIAAGANTSIGSVYQFFPNKRAIFREVAHRALVLSGEIFSELMASASPKLGWADLVDRAIDSYWERQKHTAIARAVWRNVELYNDYADEDQAQMRQFMSVTAGMVGMWAPSIAPAKRTVVAKMVVNTIVATLLMATREDDDGQARSLIAEAKVMLRRYIEGYLNP